MQRDNRHVYGFNHKNADMAMEEFRARLGAKNEWFVRFVAFIQDINRRRKVTDIVIRENVPIEIVRPFPPSIVPLGNPAFRPSGDDINMLTKCLLDRELKYLDDMSTIDFSIVIYGVGVFRINYSQHEMGVELSVRYLDFDIPDFESLRYTPYYKNWIKGLVRERTMQEDGGRELNLGYVNSGGLILHIGPTGSGKTTAIASELKYIADRINVPMLTYEKPIEYRLLQTKAMISQYELGRDIREQNGLQEFDVMKNNLLRKSPSVILIAEVKTEHEIFELVDIANRGHLVFSTMHSQNIVEAISVMMSVMKNSRRMLASGLKAIVAHYLYLSLAGNIVPLYEIFIPDKTVRKKIYDNNTDDIRRIFYLEKQLRNSITFSDYIDMMLRENVITQDDKKEILASMMFDID